MRNENNKEMKHTKGPWRIDIAQFTSDLFGAHTGFNIWGGYNSQTGVCNVTLNNAVGVPEKVRYANAKLIAAAPEMLEALKIVDAFFQDNYTVESLSFWPRVKQAIEKATK